MKKKIFTCIVILLACVVFVAAFDVADFHLTAGWQEAEFKKPIVVKNGSAYVPLREFCEFLKIPVSWDGATRTITVDPYRKSVGILGATEHSKHEMVPDKETAIALGRIFLEVYTETQMEYETTENIYYLDAMEDPAQNAWIVYQTYDMKNGGGWASSVLTPCVWINRNTGEVLAITPESTLWENPPLK